MRLNYFGNINNDDEVEEKFREMTKDYVGVDLDKENDEDYIRFLKNSFLYRGDPLKISDYISYFRKSMLLDLALDLARVTVLCNLGMKIESWD